MNKIDLSLDGFTGIEITTSLDAVSDEFRFNLLQTDNVKKLFAPFSFSPVSLAIADENILSGYVLATSAALSASNVAVTAQGASKGIVLANSTLPAINLENKTLADVCRFVCQKFGLDFQEKVASTTVPRASCERGTVAFDFLNNLAREQKCLLYSLADGSICLDSSSPDLSKIYKIDETSSQGFDVSVQFDGTKFAHFYVASGQVNNQNLYGDYEYDIQPLPFIRHLGIEQNPNLAIKNQIVRDNIEAMKVSLSVQGWENPEGKMWQKGQVFQLNYPSLWLDDESKFRARSITFSLDAGNRSTSFVLEKIVGE